jgi:hypothetical protein
MGSDTHDIRDRIGLSPRDSYNYPVLAFSVVGNLLLFVRWVPDGGLSTPFVGLLAVLLVSPPVVMGYTDQPFSFGVCTGVLPMIIFAVVDHWHLPITATEIQTIVQGSIFWAGMALPVATLLFVVGVIIRKRNLKGNHVRALAWRVLLACVLSATIFILRDMTNVLATGELH